MCVIIIKKENLQVPSEVLRTSARINPHGLGIVWLDNFEVSYHKSSEYRLLETKRPFIAHFRYATIGAVNKSNTHPFKCGESSHELLMMNGTIKGLGNHKESDSKVLAKSLGQVPRNLWKSELEQYECRFVTINTKTKSYQMYNREMWHQKDGIWYSKDNVLETNLVAVYGTLKKYNSNYWNYLSESTMVGSGHTRDKYPLVISGLPYLIEKSGVGHNVEVDVFRVTDKVLIDLDRLEGHPHWYIRKEVPIRMKGQILKCWIYFNKRETCEGKKLHKTFIQARKNYGNWQTRMFDSRPSVQPMRTRIYQEIDTDFNVDKENPMCVNCYNDLSFDGFSHYYCSQCHTWHTENEILTRFK